MVTVLHKSRVEAVKSLNLDVNTIFEWSERNLVKFNENKTQVCTFSRKKVFEKVVEFPFVVNNHVLESCDSIRLLGVQLLNSCSTGVCMGDVSLKYLRKYRLYHGKKSAVNLNFL